MQTLYSKLLTYAYNIIGKFEDAEDVVQDAMEKYISIDKSHIENESNYLIKTVINLSLNHKKKHKRTSRFGVWLPEPVATQSTDEKLIQEQVANYSLMVLFESLNPKERTIFILKEGFDYSHEEIAQLLDINIDNSRQLLSRAKKKIGKSSFHEDIVPKEQLEPYISALMNADTEALENLFAKDISLMADGGSTVKVVTSITQGKQPTAQLMQYVYAMFLDGKEYKIGYINHQPALCFYNRGKLYSCLIFTFSYDGKPKQIYSMVDPEKLKNLKV